MYSIYRKLPFNSNIKIYNFTQNILNKTEMLQKYLDKPPKIC